MKLMGSLTEAKGNYSKYVDSDDQVSDLVVRCLGLSGIALEGKDNEESWPAPIYTLSSRNLDEVVRVVQGRVNPNISWLRQGERWGMSNPDISPATAREILKLSQEDFGFKDSVFPQDKSYEGLLILASDAQDFTDRVLFASKLAQEGIEFNSVYLLGGRRKLEDFEKEAFPYLSSLSDEREMMEEIFSKNADKRLQGKKTTVYSEPPEGRERATTESTVHAFMKLTPPSGKYLCISNGIYVPYQELVIQNALDKYYPESEIKVQCVGPAEDTFEAASDEQMLNSASVFLDNLSRILYNLQMRKTIVKDRRSSF